MKKILEEFDDRLKEFVPTNTDQDIYLLAEDFKSFLSEKLDQARAEERARLMGIIKSNSKGAFTDDGGNNCWYVDDLLSSLQDNPDKK